MYGVCVFVCTGLSVWNPGGPAQEWQWLQIVASGILGPCAGIAVATNRGVWNPGGPAQGSAVATNRGVWNPGGALRGNCSGHKSWRLESRGALRRGIAVATNRGVWNPGGPARELQWPQIVTSGILGALRGNCSGYTSWRLEWGGTQTTAEAQIPGTLQNHGKRPGKRKLV